LIKDLVYQLARKIKQNFSFAIDKNQSETIDELHRDVNLPSLDSIHGHV